MLASLPSAKSPESLLLVTTFLMSLLFATWQVLLNNFVIERAAFTGVEIGILQSLREVPGFLAFTAVFLLLVIKEQSLVLISVAIMALGVALTGLFPWASGLYLTTMLMSVGFHYFETIHKSLTLQWLSKEKASQFMGMALSMKAAGSLLAYSLIFIFMKLVGVDYVWMYLFVGVFGLMLLVAVTVFFPRFKQPTTQHKHLVFRSRYWLYYGLVFLGGARRQIFVVFAGFLMVEKFGYDVGQVSALFIVNYLFNLFFAPLIGKWIGVLGERRALMIEYSALIGVFTGYAFVESSSVAAGLYVVDHLFFAFAIAHSTYFQKIADDKDIASTASVSFTINHIAAVVIPALLGFVWLTSPASVFLIGSALAALSLLLSFNIPRHPQKGQEVLWGGVKQASSTSKV